MEPLQQFEQIWKTSSSPPDVFAFLGQSGVAKSQLVLAVLLADQQRRWQTDKPLMVEDYLAGLPDLATNEHLVLELAANEFQCRRSGGACPSMDEYGSRFPAHSERLQRMLSFEPGDRSEIPSVNLDRTRLGPEDTGQSLRELVETSDDRQRRLLPDEPTNIGLGNCPVQPSPSAAKDQPGLSSTVTYISSTGIGVQQKGRYRLVRVLGEGAFGRVYLGFDEELRRQVAIKVPTAARFLKPEDAEAYLAEARVVASLDHPHIVPVYDVGRTQAGSIYVVSKFIEGPTLEERVKGDRSNLQETARQIATIAHALQHAHQKRLIHRDIKPANILIEDKTNTPYVADFGLAIREEDYLNEIAIAGTAAYMSPEQARGEGHRLDGRSDVFALGVILYQMLTGKKPFRGSSVMETLHQVISQDPRPPRELLETIPAELERICLKALSKRASDRYSTAAEFAEDLQQWLKPATAGATQPKAFNQVVPKGLRSFDANDADFFLDLLPGVRNRDGLPESIAFWKQRIEQTDPEQTFSVGLIYGPSGCGKSSLVKAGLLPHLSKDVIAVYVEATAEDTETRILRGLRKRLPELSETLDLADTLAALRRGHGRKVVIIIDQFEQWLHAHPAKPDAELVKALRQCDGGRLQTIVMVRDDFAMAAARFMSALDVPIVQGQNFATVDLFDVDHAANVLTRFGQALGKLPGESGVLSAQERQFIQQVASGLAREDKVVPVRLSLFAEMVKSKPWNITTLKQVGGTDGLGVNFLEETFSSLQANPNHRRHSVAAHGVLRALLPKPGTDIRGHMRSRADLLAASGYQDCPSDFADLLRILDGELRLITPTDPNGHESQSGSDVHSQYYQLPHDYLVPALWEWLTRKQKETRKGRAELTLSERSTLWNAKPNTRYLPSLAEWIAIWTLTESKRWTNSQKVMMQRAARLHVLRSGLVIAGIIAFVTVGSLIQSRSRIKGLIRTLVTAAPGQVSGIIAELDQNQQLADPLLLPLVSLDPATDDEHRSQLHARLARVSRDETLVDPLMEELLTNELSYVGPIRDRLRPYSDRIIGRLQAILHDETATRARRFRAALPLADLLTATNAPGWTAPELQFVAQQLTMLNAENQPTVRSYLRPIADKLLPELEHLFVADEATGNQRVSAANACADFAAKDKLRLARLLTNATPEQYEILYPLVAGGRTGEVRGYILSLTHAMPTDSMSQQDRVSLGRHRACAAITLLRQGERESIFEILRVNDDPESLSQFVSRCQLHGVTAEQLLECLDRCDEARKSATGTAKKLEARVMYGLLLALGNCSLNQLPLESRDHWVARVADLYENDPSAAIHGASGWLLRQWGQGDDVERVDHKPVDYDPSGERQWYTLAIPVKPATSTMVYFTFIVFPAGEYQLGSEEGEAERQSDEVMHWVQLTRPVAICDRELTWQAYDVFDQSQRRGAWQRQFGRELTAREPVFGLNWYEAITYCRWLSRQAGLPETAQCYDDPERLLQDEEGNPKYDQLYLDRAGFRMPTEGEWEVACRSGMRTPYAFGGDASLLGEYGWFSRNSNKWSHRAGEKRPNAGGLFDMHGNMLEWCHDRYGAYEDTRKSVDPVGAATGLYRVFRGGSWTDGAAVCRSAARFNSGLAPTFRNNFQGLRLALSPASVQLPEAEKRAEPAGGGTKGVTSEQRREMP